MRSLKRIMLGSVAASAALVSVAVGPAAASGAQPDSTQALCNSGYFCAFPEPNFTGLPINMFRCADYAIPWTTVGSWINNQTGGARAQFKSSDGVVRWTSGVAWDEDRNADWSWVYNVKPCWARCPGRGDRTGIAPVRSGVGASGACGTVSVPAAGGASFRRGYPAGWWSEPQVPAGVPAGDRVPSGAGSISNERESRECRATTS